MEFLAILLLFALVWLAFRLYREGPSGNLPSVFRKRQRAAAPAATDSRQEHYVRLCNSSIKNFDNTDDLATKFYEMTLLEKNLKELLKISPEHQTARQVARMMPEMRRKVESKIIGSNKPVQSHQAEPAWPEHCEEIERAWKGGDYDWARQQLQRIAYTMIGSAVTAEERANFTRLMAEFANEDPLYEHVMERVLPLVRDNPGILQSQIYKGQPDDIKEQMRYVLYFAAELGHIRRVKKGNSYQLMLPERAVGQDL